ncbi:hypothetical protein CDIK_1458 [Cucumispora dikerogammari]|nr:hypothetical protein CDIK_1458 [Cucumispora dikerogammari]
MIITKHILIGTIHLSTLILHSHQTLNELFIQKKDVLVENLFTSTSVLDKTDNGGKVLKQEVFKLTDQKNCNSILIPLFEISNKDIDEKLKKIKNFNNSSNSLCKESTILIQKTKLVSEQSGSTRLFKNNAKLFILKTTSENTLLLCIFLNTVEGVFFSFFANNHNFCRNNHDEHFKIEKTMSIEIEFDFETKEFKSLSEQCRLGFDKSKKHIVKLKVDSNEKEKMNIYYSYIAFFSDKFVNINRECTVKKNDDSKAKPCDQTSSAETTNNLPSKQLIFGQPQHAETNSYLDTHRESDDTNDSKRECASDKTSKDIYKVLFIFCLFLVVIVIGTAFYVLKIKRGS